MKLFEKGKLQIVILLVVFMSISLFVLFTSFSAFSIRSLNPAVEMRFYAGFCILFGIFVFVFTHRKFSKGSALENAKNFKSETEEMDEAQRLAQEKLKKEEMRKKAEEEKKQLTIMVNETTAGLDQYSDANEYFDHLLINLSKVFDIVEGVAYLWDSNSQKFAISGTYAYYSENTDHTFVIGEGITGQVAKDRKLLVLDNVPEGYVKAGSGLGSTSKVSHLTVAPVVMDKQTVSVVELASFQKASINYNLFFELLNANISEKVASMAKYQKFFYQPNSNVSE